MNNTNKSSFGVDIDKCDRQAKSAAAAIKSSDHSNNNNKIMASANLSVEGSMSASVSILASSSPRPVVVHDGMTPKSKLLINGTNNGNSTTSMISNYSCNSPKNSNGIFSSANLNAKLFAKHIAFILQLFFVIVFNCSSPQHHECRSRRCVRRQCECKYD